MATIIKHLQSYKYHLMLTILLCCVGLWQDLQQAEIWLSLGICFSLLEILLFIVRYSLYHTQIMQKIAQNQTHLYKILIVICIAFDLAIAWNLLFISLHLVQFTSLGKILLFVTLLVMYLLNTLLYNFGQATQKITSVTN